MVALINTVIQQSSLDTLIEMYQLDTAILGGGIYYFTSSAYSDHPVVFGGHTYTPIEFEASGFEWSGTGKLPTPKVKIGNVSQTLTGLAIEFNDLMGATITRLRTFKQFLDGEANADPTQKFPDEVYRIERKATMNKIFIEFELSSVIDQEGKKLPGRQMIRNVCTHTYRKWTGAAFDYTNATCPYVAATYYNEGGSVTTAANDKCSKLLNTGCRLRFGQAALPTRAFPGLAKIRPA